MNKKNMFSNVKNVDILEKFVEQIKDFKILIKKHYLAKEKPIQFGELRNRYEIKNRRDFMCVCISTICNKCPWKSIDERWFKDRKSTEIESISVHCNYRFDYIPKEKNKRISLSMKINYIIKQAEIRLKEIEK